MKHHESRVFKWLLRHHSGDFFFGEIAEIVEFCSANFPGFLFNSNFLYPGSAERENLFDSDASGNFADGVGFGVAVNFDDDAFENLQTGFVALQNFLKDADGVTNVKTYQHRDILVDLSRSFNYEGDPVFAEVNFAGENDDVIGVPGVLEIGISAREDDALHFCSGAVFDRDEGHFVVVFLGENFAQTDDETTDSDIFAVIGIDFLEERSQVVSGHIRCLGEEFKIEGSPGGPSCF